MNNPIIKTRAIESKPKIVFFSNFIIPNLTKTNKIIKKMNNPTYNQTTFNF